MIRKDPAGCFILRKPFSSVGKTNLFPYPTGRFSYPGLRRDAGSFQDYEIDPSGTKTKFIRIGIETFVSKKTTSVH